MAINPAVVKGVAGITAVGGTGVVGYIYRGPLLDAWNADYQTFLVKASSVTGTEDLKDYFCESNSQIDNDCKVIQLDFNKQKHLDGDAIIKSQTYQTAKLTNDSFYKLSINKDKIKSFSDESGKSFINLKTGSGSAATVFSKLQIISHLNESEIEKSTLLDGLKILVKSNSSFTGENLNNLKCKNTDKSVEVADCKIYKFEDASHKHLFDFSKIKKITKLNEIQSAQYYVVDLLTADKTKFLVNEKSKIHIFENTTEKGVFSTISNIFANIDESSNPVNANTQALILSSNFGKNSPNKTYIIAKSETISEHGFASQKESYQCNLSQKVDSNCTIIELTDNEKTLLQATNAETKPTSLHEENKYYKIFTNNEVITAVTNWSSTTSIVIKSKTTTDSKEYGKLKPIFLVEDGKITKGKTTLLIATAKAVLTRPNNASESTQYQCKFGAQASAVDCDVYKFSDSEINMDAVSKKLTGKIDKVSTSNDWSKGKMYFVDLKTTSVDHSATTTPNTKDLQVTVKVSNTSTDIGTLTINHHVFNKTTFSNADIGNLFLI